MLFRVWVFDVGGCQIAHSDTSSWLLFYFIFLLHIHTQRHTHMIITLLVAHNRHLRGWQDWALILLAAISRLSVMKLLATKLNIQFVTRECVVTMSRTWQVATFWWFVLFNWYLLFLFFMVWGDDVTHLSGSTPSSDNDPMSANVNGYEID